MAMAPRRKISKEEVIEKLKDDGDFDSLRLQIIRRLKDNVNPLSLSLNDVFALLLLNKVYIHSCP